MWAGSLSTRAQWFLIVGLYFGSRIVRSALRENPSLWPILGPLMALYVLFVFGSWIADPLSNLLLRLNPIGRLALNRFETAASNVVGVCVAMSAIAGLAFLGTRSAPWLVLAGVCALLLIPVGGAAKAHGTRAWGPLAAAVMLLGACGAAAVVLSFAGASMGPTLVVTFLLGSFLYGWVANYFLLKY
jgi:hypothetical protein